MQILLKTLLFPNRIKSIGFHGSMDELEKRKLGIFNLLNVLGFFIGIFLPIVGLFIARIELPVFAWIVTFSPAMVSILVLLCNHLHRYEFGALLYFVMYPISTAMVYQVSFDVGVELFFLLYGVLSVFFLKRFLHIAFAFLLTLSCYFYVFVFTKNYEIQLLHINFHFYVLNHVLPACFIFYALFLVKKENTQYQVHLQQSNDELQRVNLEIQKQKEVIDEKARLLQKQNHLIDEKAKLLQQQTSELTELNTMKNKLFSVISHDLKTPLYALRNLFRSVQQYDLPAEEIKTFVPEVIKDLNYTTALMENLLLWVKSQMQANVVNPQILEVRQLVQEAMDLLRLQAHAKLIRIQFEKTEPIYIYGDKDMISLVIRNLLSNAIKFTPQDGLIEIGVNEHLAGVEIFVKDSGVGMEPQVLKKLFDNNYYSTKGTANETGTGIGLMLCKDFIARNGGQIHVTSEPGKGSTFAISLPRKMRTTPQVEKK